MERFLCAERDICECRGNIESEHCKWMGRHVRAVARYAMQCRSSCATQFVEGEFGVSSYWAREPQAKASYEARLQMLERDGRDN